MEHWDNQPDGHKADEPLDPLQALLERCYRTIQLPHREAVDADFQTGLAGDE
jgi:hypothetical protein